MMPAVLQQVIQEQPHPLLFVTLSGAHLYGFASADSDYDLRGVHVLPIDQVVGLQTGPDTLEMSAVRAGVELDLVTHDVLKFFTLLLRKNGYVLEQLYSPLILHTTPEHAQLKAVAAGCITRHHVHHYLGFAQTQWKLFLKETPPRVKPLLYVYRVLLTGIHLMCTGQIEANLPALNQEFCLPYVDDLIDRKLHGSERGTLPATDLKFHQREYERLCTALREASQTSALPESPTVQSALHDLLLRLRCA